MSGFLTISPFMPVRFIAPSSGISLVFAPPNATSTGASSGFLMLISAASSTLFGWDSFTDLGGPRDLAKIFSSSAYAKWKSFRNSEDSRYVSLTLPHILMRLPYGQANIPVESFNYEEDVEGKVHNKYLWGNAAYALGTRLTDAFAKYHWTAAIRGVEGGGLVQGLPVHTFKTDEGDVPSSALPR